MVSMLSSIFPWLRGQDEAPNFTLVTEIDIDSRSFRSPLAHWPSETPATKGLFERFVESCFLETLVSTCVAVDLVLTAITFIASEEVAESDTIFYLSAGLLIVLLLDVLLRILKDGKAFFLKWLNWLELVVCVGGGVMLVIDGVERACTGDCGKGNNPGKGASVGRAVRPLMRIFRVLRALSHVLGSQSGLLRNVDKMIDQKTDMLIRNVLGDLLEVPEDNMDMKATQGQFHLEKAQVRPTVFAGLHLPFTIIGGLIDMMHFDVDLMQKNKSKKNDHSGHRLLIIIENLMLVVGPGHHEEKPAPSWNFQAVLESKKRLVDLIAGRLQQTQFAWNKEGGGAKKKKKKADSSLAAMMKKKMSKAVSEVLAHGMHVSIKNVELRYEDARGEVSGGPVVVGGFEIGSVQLRAQGVGEETFETEEHFRVKGKWRPGTGARHEDGPIKKDSILQSSSTKSIKSASFDQGIRAALHIDRLAAFWDIHEAGTPLEQTGAHAHHLQEDATSTLSFLKDLNRKRARERVRLAACAKVERDYLLGQSQNQMNRVRRLTKPSWSGSPLYDRSEQRLTAAESKAAAERMRRLKEKVAAHRYLLMPCGCSVHAIYRPPRKAAEAAEARGTASEKTGLSSENSRTSTMGSTSSISSSSSKIADSRSVTDSQKGPQVFWPPQTDIDVHIPSIPFQVDLSQARSMVGLLDYLKRWKVEDHRYMWFPSPHHSGFHTAFARWGYALRMVLSSIDERYPWHSLAWVEMRRRGRINDEYSSALTSDVLDEDRIAMLQVSLPLPEIIMQRIAAAKIRLKHEANKKQGKRTSIKVEKQPTVELDDAAARQARQEEIKAAYRSVQSSVKDIKGEIHLPAHLRSFQFQLCLDSVQVHVLGLQHVTPRRSLLRFEVSGVYVVASTAAPHAIWMRLAPPLAVASAVKKGEWPESFAAEVALEDIRVVICAMPSSTTGELRRLIGPPRQMRKAFNASSRLVGGDGGWELRKMVRGADEAFGKTGSLVRHSDRFFMQARLAFSGYDVAEVVTENGHLPKIPHWEMAAWTFPMEVHMCQPLIKQLATNFKRQEHVPRWIDGSLEKHRFWDELKKKKDLHRATTVKREKKARRAEIATGIAGPLVGSRLNGEILLRGGMLGAEFRVYSQATWLKRSGTCPAGKVKIDRVVDGGPQLKAGFLPSAPNLAGHFQSADGWWFDVEAEAQQATRLLTGQPLNTGDEWEVARQDESWVGSVAHEDPLAPQESQFTLPRHVLSTWGHNPDGSIRSRYKPPVSAKGLLPLALPEKRRSGSSMGFAVDCCRSLERNVPDPMKPALVMLAATLPEDGLAACCASPQSAVPGNSGPGRPPPVPAEAQTLPLISPGTLAPSFMPDNPNAVALSPDTKPALEAERKSPAQGLLSMSEMEAKIEVLSSKSIGLPNPSPAGLRVWWRSLGMITD